MTEETHNKLLEEIEHLKSLNRKFEEDIAELNERLHERTQGFLDRARKDKTLCQ